MAHARRGVTWQHGRELGVVGLDVVGRELRGSSVEDRLPAGWTRGVTVRIAGKVIVVVGGGNGIGREVVLELLRRKARVAAVDLRQDGLDETAALAGAGKRLATFQLDITDRQAVGALPTKVVEVLGPVDGLINVAGIIQPFVRLNDLDYEAIERVIDVNLYGTLHTVKAFLPRLLERPVAHVANVASMGAFLPVPGQTIYGASKAAVKLMTEGLYAELLDTQVGVSLVLPGAVGTDITANSGVEVPGSGAADQERAKHKGTAADVAARIIVDGIEADKFHIYVGRDSTLLNRFSRIAPRRATHLIQSRMKDLLG
jgi:NAD(P)-dependent dehydrogenase (short-subunit alcohol dehydrogenase family)